MANKLWDTYAGTWTLAGPERIEVLATCVDADVTYCDPSSKVSGIENLSAHMAGFQENFPGARFRIRNVYEHNSRTIAKCDLVQADDAVAMRGISFAQLGEDGKMQEISGFFES